MRLLRHVATVTALVVIAGLAYLALTRVVRALGASETFVSGRAFNLADDGTLFIHSFDHGRSFYSLRYDLKSAKEAFDKIIGGGTVDDAMAILAQAELEQDELDEFALLEDPFP